MTVTINSIGTNSRQLVISGETSAANIIAGINTALVALGWTLFDSMTSGSNNCMVTKVYSAPNNDTAAGGPTTKYMILRYDSPQGFWYCSACESWNATTHVATNETFNNGRNVPLPLQYGLCTLYVYATARYACFMGVVNGEIGPWQGVFEFEREAPEDTIANGPWPCFGWTCSLMIGEVYAGIPGASASYGSFPCCFSFPRTRSGNTGQAAMQEMSILTAYGMFPPPANQIPTYGSSGGVTNAVSPHNGHLGSFGQAYKWDAGKKVASSLKLYGFQAAYNVGRIYGLTVIPATGNILDTVVMPLDTNMFFNTTGGTNANTNILAINGGYYDTAGIGAGKLTQWNATAGTLAGAVNQMELVKGDFIYIAGAAGIVKFQISTNAWTTISTASTPITDCVHDGGIYIYFATAAGVTRLSTVDDSLTTLSCGTGGTQALAIDDTYLYASDRTASTTPKLECIALSTFTVTGTYTSPALTGSQSFNTLITADYSGTVFAACLCATSATLADIKVWKITPGASPTAVISAQLANARISSVWGCLYWDGTYIMGTHGTAATYAMNALTPGTNSEGALTSTSGVISSFGGRAALNNCMQVFKGYNMLVGSAAANAFMWPNRLCMLSPTTLDVLSSPTNAIITGVIATAAVTDGCNLYTSGATNQMVRIQNGYGINNSGGNASAQLLVAM